MPPRPRIQPSIPPAPPPPSTSAHTYIAYAPQKIWQKKLQELTRTAQAVGERMTVRRRTCSIHGQGGRRARPGWSRAFPRRRLTRSHQGQRRPRRQWLHSDKLRRPAGPGKLFASTSVEGSESLTGRVIVAVTLFLRGFTADHLVVSFVRTASYAHTGSERWR